MKTHLNTVFGSRLSEPMPPELSAIINRDSQEILSVEELERWHAICQYQIEHHPDMEMRDLFKEHRHSGKLRRSLIEAAAAFAIAPAQCKS